MFLTYAAPKGHAVIDRELYLPKEWMDDLARCREAKIPEDTLFKTKPQMALEMLKSSHEAGVPFSWVTVDSIYGDFRDIGMWPESRTKGCVMAVSGQAYIWQGFTQRLYDWMLIPANDPRQKAGKAIFSSVGVYQNPRMSVLSFAIIPKIHPLKNLPLLPEQDGE